MHIIYQIYGLLSRLCHRGYADVSIISSHSSLVPLLGAGLSRGRRRQKEAIYHTARVTGGERERERERGGGEPLFSFPFVCAWVDFANIAEIND